MKTTTSTLPKYSIATIALIALFVLSSTAAFAAGPEFGQMRAKMSQDRNDARQEFMRDLTDEQKEILEEVRALRESGDHDAAKELLDEAGIEPPMGPRAEFIQSLTDEQKEILEQAHELAKEGDHEAAKALLEEAGIERPQMGEGPMNKEVRDAIESGDYEAFLEATADAPVDIEITEEQFEGMAKVHALMQSGDHEAARELAEELGLPKFGKRAGKKFIDNLTDEQKEILGEAHELAKSGDHEAAKELLEESDIEMPKPGLFKKIGNWFKRNSDSE